MPTRIDRLVPEKDVLHYRIQLPHPATPENYLAWSRTQLDTESEHMAPDYPDTRVYEIFYSFFRGTEKLASVQFRRGEDAPGSAELQHVRTLVFQGAP